MAAVAFLSVLRRPGVWRPAAGAVLASVPIGMLGLAVLLLVQRSQGRFAPAGLAVGLLGAGTALGMVVQGRLIDRYGQTRVLFTAAGGQLTAMIGLVIAGRSDAIAAVLVCAFLSGAGEPQVNASLRALWPTLVPARLLPTAMTLSSVLFEAPVLLGPLLLTAVLSVTGPAVAILLCAALFACGTTMLATSRASRAWRGAARGGDLLGAPGAGGSSRGVRGGLLGGSGAGGSSRGVRGGLLGGSGASGSSRGVRGGLLGALAGAGVRTTLIVAAGHGVIIGVVQVSAAVRFTGDAGFMYAALSAGSLVGAVAAGTRLQSGRPAWWLAVLTAVGAAALGAASLAATPVAFAASLFGLGACLGPAGVLVFSLAGRLAPPEHAVEAFTMITAAGLSAVAAGATVAGAAADRFGPAGTFLVTAAGGLVVAALVAVRRRSLPPGQPE